MATNKKEELTNAAHVLNPIYNVNGFLTSSEQVLDEVIGKNQGAINQTINDGNISTIDNYFAIYKSNTYSGTDIFNDPEMNWVLIKDSKGKDIPEMTKDKPYLWNYKQINFIGGSKTGDEYIAPQIIPPSVVAVYSGIYKLEVFYQVTNDSINHPTETDENWKTDSPATTKEKPFLWQKRVTYFADKPNTPRTVEFNLVGTLGEPGIDGTDIEYIFKLTNTNTAPSNPTPKDWNAPDTEDFHNTYQDSDWKDETNGWYDDPQEPSFTMQFEWICERKKVFEKSGVDANGRTVGKYVWGQFTKPALWAKYSKEGVGIVEVKEAYLVSNVGTNITEQTLKDKSNESAPGETTSDNYNTWYKNSPNVTVDYKYIWKRTTTKFKREDLPDTIIDESSERESVIYEMIGTLGEPGIDGTDIEYIFKLTNTNTAPSNPTPKDWNAPDTEDFHNTYQDSDWKDETNGWYDDPKSPTYTNPYEWICERKRKFIKTGIDVNGQTTGYYQWQQYSAPTLWARYSKEGIGIVEVIVSYLKSNINKVSTTITNANDPGIDAPSNAQPNVWYNTSPEVTNEHKYLWKRTKTKFNRGDASASEASWKTVYEVIGSMGDPGIDGAGIEWIHTSTLTLDTVPGFKDGYMNTTGTNGKKYSDSDYIPHSTDGANYIWSDDCPEPSPENYFIWRSQRRFNKATGLWGAFSTPITIYSYNTSSFKSTVFCRSEKAPETPTGGSYSSPWPTGTIWKDGIPEGTGENLWMSTRIFSSDSLGLQQAAWTEPTKLSDSVDMEIIYTANYNKKDIPADFKKESATSSNIDPTWKKKAAEVGWYDTPEQCGGDPWWMAVIYKVDGAWNDDWQISKIRGENGISPTTQFKSFVFCRSLSTPSKPEGGSYSSPLPEGTLWKDGIPTGNNPIWSSSRIFFSDNAASDWSAPIIMADTPDIEYIYSSFRNPQSPPDGFSKLENGNWNSTWGATANSLGWYDEPGNCKDDSGNSDTNPWWMAISRRINGTWSAWEKSKIRGEDGEDGTSITVKGKFNSLAELKAAFPNGPADPSHTYIVGTHLYVWDGDSWEDMGEFKGEPGASAFLHIKYASSVIYDSNGNVSKVTLTGANGEEPGDYIGTFSDSNENDPSDEESLLEKYTWKYWKGEDGFGYEYIYQLSNTYSAPNVPEYKYAEDGSEIAVNGKFSYNDDYVPEGWFDNPPSVSTTNKYAWVCYRKKISGAWTEYIGSTDKPGKASLWASMGKDGEDAIRLSFNTPFITYSTSPSNLISEDIVYSIKAKLYRGNVELNVKEYELYFDVNGDIPKGPETSDPTNSTASTGTAGGTTTTPVPGSAEAIKQTLKGYITCKRDDDESNNQFIITVKQPSGLNKTNRIDTIIISVYGDSDLLVANGTIQALYTQRGEAGPSAAVGKTSYPAGTWDAGTNYKSTDTSTPYVWYDSTKKYYLLIADSAQGTSQSPENSSYWNPMDSFKAIYTEFLMADNANLGSANGSIIYSNLLYSQLGRDENGIDNRHYSVYVDKDGGMYSESEVTDVYSGTSTIHSFNGKFIPNTFIDFYRGSIACNKLSETYSYFNLYNSNGNINYIYEMDLNKSHNISINPRIDDYDSPYQVNWKYGTVVGYPGLIILPDYSTSSTWAEDGIHITITHQVDINWLKSQNSNFDHSNNSIVLVAADSRMFDSTKYNDSSITTDGKNLFLWRGVASKIIAIQPGATIKLRSSITFEETWINGELKKTAVGRNWIIENSEDFEPTKMYISVNNEKLYDLTVDPGAHNNPTPIVLGGNILSYPRLITDSGVTTNFNLSKSKFNSRGNVEDIITENNAYCFRVTTNPSSTENSNIELAWDKNDLGV